MLLPKKLTPLKYAEVIGGLKSLGFEMKPKTGTAHEQWVAVIGGKKRVVTVDKHIAPFSKDLIKFMANQAGMNVRKFHALCKGNATAEEINMQTTND